MPEFTCTVVFMGVKSTYVIWILTSSQSSSNKYNIKNLDLINGCIYEVKAIKIHGQFIPIFKNLVENK